jgi:hypothetical protein
VRQSPTINVVVNGAHDDSSSTPTRRPPPKQSVSSDDSDSDSEPAAGGDDPISLITQLEIDLDDAVRAVEGGTRVKTAIPKLSQMLPRLREARAAKPEIDGLVKKLRTLTAAHQKDRFLQMAREIFEMAEQLMARPRIRPKLGVEIKKPEVRKQTVTVQGFSGDPELQGDVQMLQDSLICGIEPTQ